MAFPSEPIPNFLRPRVERWVGLVILFAPSFTLGMLTPSHPFSIPFYCIQAISFWALWRSHSLHSLKFELCLYLNQFVLSALWTASIFFWQQPLLSLIALLLQTVATLLCTLVFWRRERISGQWMALSLAWQSYLCFLFLYNP